MLSVQTKTIGNIIFDYNQVTSDPDVQTFPLYTPNCHMLLSKQKCFLLLTGVSTESQKRTSIPQTKWAFLATRSMTRMNVGIALSYVKLLLSSWKIYI